MISFIDAAHSVLSLSEEDIIKYARMDQFEADRMLASLWIKLNPQSEEDVIKYYTDNKEFTLFHLRFLLNMDENYRNIEFFTKIKMYIPDVENYKILDYGCGSGSMGLTFANSGCRQVTLTDIPLPLFKIVQKMFGDSGKVIFREINEKYPLKENYDLIICVDVLEHVKDPDMVLRHLIGHLGVGKYLYLETFFGGSDYAPFHLIDNNKFIPIWKDVLKVAGLSPISMNDKGGTNGLWQRVL